MTDKTPVDCYLEETGQQEGDIPEQFKAEFQKLLRDCENPSDGDRSRADFFLMCAAIENGITKEIVRQALSTIGKTAERGDDYFEGTWGKADAKVKSNPSRNSKSRQSAAELTTTDDPHADDGIRNFFTVKSKEEEIKIGLAAPIIAQRVAQISGGWPRRVGPLLFVPDGFSPLYLEQTSDLFGWIARVTPSKQQCVNPVQWVKGQDKLTQQHFDAFLRQSVPNYLHVNPYPHEPTIGGHYYLHPQPQPTGGNALNDLLSRFNPATTVDKDLLLAFLLTLVWGGKPGQRPAFLFTAPPDDPLAGRGVGKTSCPRLSSKLVGGFIQWESNDEMADLKKRILSPDGRSKRVLLIDNVKSHKFSCAELEAFITGDTISGRQLYFGEGQIPNLFITCITINGATLSKDLAQRCVIIELARPKYTATWENETTDLIDSKRWNIIGDLLDILKQPPKLLAKHSRWASWERDVLSRVTDPVACQKVIVDRQDAVDEDEEEKEIVRSAFQEHLRRHGHDPEIAVVQIPSSTAATIVELATQERRPVNKASAYLKTLGIIELRKSDRGAVRGWVWTGQDAPQGTTASPMSALTSPGARRADSRLPHFPKGATQ